MLTSLTRQRTAFLPDFCAVRMAIAVILIAQLLAIVLTLATPGLRQQGFQVLALNSLFIQWVAVSCVALLCLLRNRLNQLPDVWSALASYLIMLGVTWIVTEIAWWIMYALPGAELEPLPDHAAILLRNLGISGIASALVLRYFYVQHQWRRHVHSEAQARLQALQARIRPHFLFNCMNTIASLIRRQPKQAEQAVEDLADVFRHSLRDNNEWVTRAEELDLCQRYLRIEQLRLGERLQVEWDTGELPDDARLPALSLQPLLENAVYHGIEPRRDGGCIRISGRLRGQQLLISIENPLPPAGSPNTHTGHQLAQENVRQRIIGFDADADLIVDTDTGLYRADIVLPYRTTPCAS
jgi:two-component system, LytTR family, sensor histidine kinase AlgZ